MDKRRFATWLREQMKARGLTGERLASMAGVSTSTIDRILGEHWHGKLHRDTIVAIADALNVPASEALRIAGYEASATFRYDTNELVAETASLLREVPEQYYSDAIRFLRRQIDTARELFVREEQKTAVQ